MKDESNLELMFQRNRKSTIRTEEKGPPCFPHDGKTVEGDSIKSKPRTPKSRIFFFTRSDYKESKGFKYPHSPSRDLSEQLTESKLR